MNYDQLDPGIRETVKWLHSFAYRTTDSGDGVSKPAEQRTFDVPHVAIRLHAEAILTAEARSLVMYCQTAGMPLAVVEASYSTADNVALLMLFPRGVNKT